MALSYLVRFWIRRQIKPIYPSLLDYVKFENKPKFAARITLNHRAIGKLSMHCMPIRTRICVAHGSLILLKVNIFI
jgi:hypothetical protein